MLEHLVSVPSLTGVPAEILEIDIDLNRKLDWDGCNRIRK
jgi:hypothetical protein